MSLPALAGVYCTTLERDDVLALFAQTLNAERHHVAGLEKALGLHAHADAWRSAGGDHVAGLQDHEVRDVRHDLRDVEDHGLGRAVLHTLAVHVEPHGEVLRIRDLVLGHEPGSKRTEGRAALALGPGAAALDLKLTLRDVVADAIAGYEIERLVGPDIGCPLADHDGQLHLPIGL